MSKSAPTKNLAEKFRIPMLALAACGMSSCGPISTSEKEFVAQHGFSRADHFGTNNGHHHVPVVAEKPVRPTGRDIKMGRPGSRNHY